MTGGDVSGEHRYHDENLVGATDDDRTVEGMR